MYFQLTAAMKRRFISELRRFWSFHPNYPEMPGNIQGKYSYKERPQYGIVVKTGSGSRVDLSADNYVGVVVSYVSLARVQNYPGLSIEWVRENAVAIQANDGYFPSPPGVYYLEMTEKDEFYVDPLIDVANEQVVQVDSLTAQLQTAPYLGTLRLFEMPVGFKLEENINYTLTLDGTGKPTGEIVLMESLKGGRTLAADYRYQGVTTGPHKIFPQRADHQAIPGVVMAFGHRIAKGDRQAIIVQDRRSPSALEYGGRWELSLDFDVMSRDVDAQQEIADQTVIYIWGVLRSRMIDEGLDIKDVSLGGESEEVYDETGDDYFYNSSFSLTVETDWSIHVPLSAFLRHAAPLTLEQTKTMAALSDEDAATFQTNLRLMEDLGLNQVQDPFFAGRDHNFEIIR